PVLAVMEKSFGMKRSLEFITGEDLLAAFEEEGSTVFAVSDSSGGSTFEMVCAALKQFPRNGVDAVTLCPEVASLEAINHIVQEALLLESLIVFTFASPGMSRFMRQQCERAKVPYADVFQPVLIAFERYLDYPPVGVPGGHDLTSSDQEDRWQKRRIPM
ncbi:unnamed protein product, partial [Polarella glacialis]